MRLNSAEGKQILATLRDGDYAHPGEDEAVALTLQGLAPDPGQRVLDVGCGRGGTAEWIRRHGWTQVVGIDVDTEVIGYARQRYPQVQFCDCDVLALPEADLGRFDLICLFNSFYAFTDQPAALRALRAVSAAGAQLRLFDYAQPAPGPLPAALGTEIGRPIALDRIADQLADAGWVEPAITDLSPRYIGWYEYLLDKLAARRAQITADHGADWHTFFTGWYGALHRALIDGQIRGVLIAATAG